MAAGILKRIRTVAVFMDMEPEKGIGVIVHSVREMVYLRFNDDPLIGCLEKSYDSVKSGMIVIAVYIGERFQAGVLQNIELGIMGIRHNDFSFLIPLQSDDGEKGSFTKNSFIVSI